MSDTERPRVVTLGEALIVLDPTEIGALRHVGTFEKSVGGSELNVAVALSRMGLRSGWAGAVGDDEFGEEIVHLLRAEGVDVSNVRCDPEAPTGVYFKERRALGGSRVHYYRSGSAASRMDLHDFDEEYLFSGEILHLTGITPCLSDGCRTMCASLMEIARERGVTVSFDANVRTALLGGRDPREVLLPFMGLADIVFMSDGEARVLLGSDDEETVSGYAETVRASQIVVHSDAGAFAAGAHGVIRAPSYGVEVVDTVGAGDAFAAGFLAGNLSGHDPLRCLEMANACGACAVTVPGDARSMPFREDVMSLVSGSGPKER